MYDVTIKTIPASPAATIAHIGSYMQISQAFEPLYGWFGARNLLGSDTRSQIPDPLGFITMIPLACLRNNCVHVRVSL